MFESEVQSGIMSESRDLKGRTEECLDLQFGPD